MAESHMASGTSINHLPPKVTVYTDGGCDPNPGPGGWGAIIRWHDREWVISGSDPDTTNNRMELQAAAAALALLHGLLDHCQVEVYTDSQYLRQGITEWIDGWVRRGWRTSDNEPVKNQDLWRLLYHMTQVHDTSWHWLRGHAGHPLNERADRLATEARASLPRGPKALHGHQVRGEGWPSVEVYVKASCLGAQGPGGWGAILRTGERSRSLSGREQSTTANVMLIRGATRALQALNRPCQVALYSDAKYLVLGASQWVQGWQARGWRTQEDKPVANQAEWQALLGAARPHAVTWLLVQGDASPGELEQAGELASRAATLQKTEALARPEP